MATQPLVLLVDNEYDVCQFMQKNLARIGIRTHIAHHLQQAKQFLSEYHYQACVADLDHPQAFGLKLIQYIFEHLPHIPVCAITVNPSIENITTALDYGAFECLSKPIQPPQLQQLLQRAIFQSSRTLIPPKADNKILIGECAAIQQLRFAIQKVSRSQTPVFIGGESGTGKEVVAHLIHKLSNRRDGPLITINCAAMAEERMESELFGQLLTSEVGAHQEKQGLIQAANGGSLFLDEIAELPLSIQVKLLRALQEKKIRPLGSALEIAVDFRILSASHQNLEQRVLDGHFRQDLFYRIHVVDMVLPPLRERGPDILILADHFIEHICADWKIRPKQLTKAAQQVLLNYDYAGNVRELRNMIERALILSDGQFINEVHLPTPSTSQLYAPRMMQGPLERFGIDEQQRLNPQIPEEGLEQFLENIEREILLHALTLTRWNRTLAAKKLGMSFRSLRYRLKKLGLDAIETQANELKIR